MNGNGEDMLQKLLIIDDDEEIRTQMRWALAQDHEVILAGDRQSGVRLFTECHPGVTLLDLGLPPCPNSPEEGLLALSEILAHGRLAKVIIVSGQGEKTNALRAIGAGAYDFVTKPVEVDELKVILKRAFHVAALEKDYRDLQQQVAADSFEGMVGTSTQIQAVFGAIRKVATTDAPVLILGESGTGKEKAAVAIHRRSTRKDGPFIPINCSAIPEALLESELFGHEKGSFTGAHAQRKGRIESAEGGTLFLDEIGEIPLQLQVKLLRFLQEQQIERVGGRQPIDVDVRVIAATNANLGTLMAEGKFREDLYYRLAVVVLQLPSLRDRNGDLRALARDFLRRFSAVAGKEGLAFDQEAKRAMDTYSWPGNVRELENRIQRAVIMAEGNRISANDLQLQGNVQSVTGTTLKAAREAVERGLISAALRRHSGRISAAAAELGISRPTLYELMEKLGIERPAKE